MSGISLLQHKANLSLIDTTCNIHRDGEMEYEALAATMNDCAVNFSAGSSEVTAGGPCDLAVDRRHGATSCCGALRTRMQAPCGAFFLAGARIAGQRSVATGCARGSGRFGPMFGNLYTYQRDTCAMDRESHA
jgi:hypothetical protein